MEFRTTFSINKSFSFSHQSSIFSIGSCFADHMGNYLQNAKFTISSNPFGVIFNPISIVELLKNSQDLFIDNQLFTEHQNIFKHFNFHSDLADFDKNNLEKKLVNSITNAHHFLKKTNILIITFGTAYVYKHIESQKIVANCHKIPQKQFEKKLLTVDEILKAFDRIDLSNIDQVILTVSPVRHIKDTIPLNSISKSTLLLACHSLCEKYSNFHYFPAYELINDDLRDYRFYKEDLIHPNEMAQKYVWEKFQDTFFEENTQQKIIEIQKIQQAIAHKPFHVNSENHQIFLKKTIEKMEKIQAEFDFYTEIEYCKQQLI